MQNNGLRETEHTIDVDAPAQQIYRLIAHVENWPLIFPPTVYAHQVEQDGRSERIQIWATANETVKHWTSRRTLDADTLRIDFRQEVSAPPVAAMGGAWIIEALSPTRSTVRLLHDFRAVDDDPDGLEWITQAVDRNSRSELAALKTNVERATGALEAATFSFTDSVRINGAAKDVYDFINEADRWRERLPHVARVVLTEESPGLQTLEMDTIAKDGSMHTTKSIRVCFADNMIVYKQTTLPALLSLHTGCWTFTEDADGTIASSQHTVVLNPDKVTAVLGADADLAKAREFVQSALSTNSLATLGRAKEFAEAKRR